MNEKEKAKYKVPLKEVYSEAFKRKVVMEVENGIRVLTAHDLRALTMSIRALSACVGAPSICNCHKRKGAGAHANQLCR